MTSVAQKYHTGALHTRSIFKKQIVAVSGAALVLYIIFHLAGNLLLLAGPEIYNGYAGRLQSLGPVLWVARLALLAVFVAHIYFTILVTLENRRARGVAYESFDPKGDRRWTTQTMIYTGLLVFAFLFLHLYDFTLSAHHGERTVIEMMDPPRELGLFGLVWNRFLVIPRSIFYILAVTAVGMHLAHGIQSAFQTVGVEHDQYNGIIDWISLAVGVLVAVGFSAIPIYVILRTYTVGV